MFNVNSQQDFSDNFYMTAGVFITCFKLCNLLTSRENYAILIGSLQKEPFTPKNDDEIEIQTRFDKWAQWNAIVYTTMIDSCLVCLLTGSIFTGYRNRKLMYRAWLPYNYSSSILFTITYAHQAAGMSICALVNSAYDTLFSGLLIHTYCIFEILGYRLKNIIKYGDNSAKQCARLHNYIYKFATMVNKEFKTVVLAQFMMSMFLLCFDLYQLTQNEMQSDFVSLVFYTFCTIMQILYYCWYGNEVKVKSLEIPNMIIESNWTSLSNDDKKILLMIMRRARVPIQFSSVKLVTVDLNSFKAVMKTSYSALNVLRNDLECNIPQHLRFRLHYLCNSTMHLMRSIFTLLAVCGCSRPSSWTTPTKKLLYTVYTFLLLLVVHSLAVTQVLDIVFNVNTQEEFTDNFYMTLGVFISCCKMCSLLTSRENYVILIESLQDEPFSPRNNDEIKILTRFNKWAQWNAIVYTTIIDTSLVCMLTASIFTDYRNRKLTYRAWLPYNYSSSISFTITYAHQVFGISLCALVNTACDSLFSGLLIHTYCIFEILGYRLKNIIKYGSDSAKQCARLHNHIYKFATMVNEEFKTVVFVQFMTSISLLCFNLYQLTQSQIHSEFASLMFYTFCTIMQILYYCWYGNEVRVKSLEIPEMIIESNWTSLNNDDKKILLMIMRRARVPIEVSSAKLITMDLNSFKTIVKTSYSALNVLRNGKVD
ncbi:uncharacterized protein LOC128886777 [Hylaeus anthracinus]|uniref:uncharacterized protein LOC128886777 n=1 Tax=Hylaeus anthracinus TaxID=313031 RepID=UPI0023B8F58C|nr:uncharacterized protein LOC128886777 [Hylaeus anthracinus]